MKGPQEMMTREAIVSAQYSGEHVYDDFGARGRVIEVEDKVALVNWIGSGSANRVRFDRLNDTNPYTR